MTNQDSHISRHARMGPRDRWAQRTSNQLAAVLFVGFFGGLALGLPVELAAPGWGALAGAVGFVSAVSLLGAARMRRGRKAAVLQRQLHDLKQQEFALRHEEAKLRGDIQ